MKKTWDTICYGLLLGLCKAVGWLPYWFLYGVLVPVIYFLVYKIAGYRTRVVRENLQHAFPEKSETERRDIERKFYKHLSELFVDTIDMTSISEKQIRKRFYYPDAANQEMRTQGKSWIGAMAHYGSWEYTINYSLFTTHRVGGVYHHLHNPVFDRFYKYTRSRFGAIPLERDAVAREMVRTRNKQLTPIALALIADQSPAVHTIHHWFDFLNQPTAFFMGVEKLARKYDLPVYFMRVDKIKKGYYTAVFEPLYDGTEVVEELEITRRYVRRLEEMIRNRPELWLWSHRRWKHTPESVQKELKR
jgi:Lauroyl/myristoyl acyltransferase